MAFSINPVALGTDSQAGYRYPLNDTYYIFQDDAGIFLRTYEKCETEEEIRPPRELKNAE